MFSKSSSHYDNETKRCACVCDRIPIDSFTFLVLFGDLLCPEFIVTFDCTIRASERAKNQENERYTQTLILDYFLHTRTHTCMDVLHYQFASWTPLTIRLLLFPISSGDEFRYCNKYSLAKSCRQQLEIPLEPGSDVNRRSIVFPITESLCVFVHLVGCSGQRKRLLKLITHTK